MTANKNGKPKKNEVIALGVDILEVDRIKEIIEKRGDKFLKRVFTPKEIKYCQSQKRSIESFAVRFSAKEAFIKAIESEINIPYQDIEVDKKANKKPKINLHGKALLAAEEKNVAEILVSLSHEKNYVTANIILKGRI
ncbi:MAG TPA: holo-ACP synthase [Halanaerobiales bacterium]|nr:holo-ACP synthase [Halanaerobiales bacterium]